LPGTPPLLYSGTLTPAQLARLLSEHAGFVITDSNRRRVWSFTGARAQYSYTLPAGQTLGSAKPGYQLFGDRPSTQTVALYPGLASITASGYGSVFGASPQYRPSNAFDGDPSTWWEAGAGADPTGAWVQATFRNPVTLSQVSLTLPHSLAVRQVRRVRLEFSSGGDVVALVGGLRHATVSFPPHRTTFLRVRIAAVGPASGPLASGAAIADIGIPG